MTAVQSTVFTPVPRPYSSLIYRQGPAAFGGPTSPTAMQSRFFFEAGALRMFFFPPASAMAVRSPIFTSVPGLRFATLAALRHGLMDALASKLHLLVSARYCGHSLRRSRSRQTRLRSVARSSAAPFGR